MKVLIVCSGNDHGAVPFDVKLHQAFIYEQVESLKKKNIEIDYFFIRGKGMKGYLKELPRLKKQLKEQSYTLIHAHNGLCGFVSNLQRSVPVVTTFHGSDINVRTLRWLSYFPLLFSAYSIFVSTKQQRKVWWKRHSSVIPCAVDTTVFYPQEKPPLSDKVSVLFASGFNIPVKNFPLAKAAIQLMKNQPIELIELTNKTRPQVAELLNTASCLLLTSLSEGSPQVIKEAMACNCPLVATPVGDIEEVIGDVSGCYIGSFDAQDIAEKVEAAILFRQTYQYTKGRERIEALGLDLESIAISIVAIYAKIAHKKRI